MFPHHPPSDCIVILSYAYSLILSYAYSLILSYTTSLSQPQNIDINLSGGMVERKSLFCLVLCLRCPGCVPNGTLFPLQCPRPCSIGAITQSLATVYHMIIVYYFSAESQCLNDVYMTAIYGTVFTDSLNGRRLNIVMKGCMYTTVQMFGATKTF